MVELILSTIVGAVIATAMVVLVLRRNKHERKAAATLRLSQAEGQQIPLSLHPVIDPTLCVGSFSCVKACPEGEIIGVVDGVATLVEAAHCIGHGRCAVECPVGAIKLVFGTAERGVDLPEADDNFESTRPGVFIIGELGGMGLIKNALRQGLVLGKTLRSRLKKHDDTLTDVVVVGGGPAGIACAVACKQNGLSVRVFEQDTLGGCIAHYPRGKVVMTEQIVMPGYGPFGRSLLSKEELLEEMHDLLARNKITIDEGHKVLKVEGEAPAFTVRTSKGAAVNCRSVVLAIGLRGSPQKLNVPGEELDKVMYRLIEPEQFHGQRVLVVGGGDSAVEAAIQLAEESTAKVSISYRQTAFTRCKPRNREKIERLIAEGRIRALLGTKVLKIDNRIVHIAAANREEPAPSVSPSLAPAASREAPKRVEASKPLPRVELPVELKAPPRKENENSTSSFRGSITGRWRARPLVSGDGPPVTLDPAASASGAPVGAAPAPVTLPPPGAAASEADLPIRMVNDVVLTRNTSSKSLSRASAAKPSMTDRVKNGVRIIIGGRAHALEDLEDGTSTLSTAQGENSGASISRDPKRKGEGRLKNDKVIISIGGQLPTAFLNDVGVKTRKYMGDERSQDGLRPGNQPTKREVEQRSRRRLAITLFALGASIIVALFIIGDQYYWLPQEQRSSSPLHPLLKPSGLWGHGVGVAATTFMIANFVYALRKRWRRLKGTASIRTWLTFHMFVGIMSPLVIGFHAAFLVNNLLAVWTWVALSVVMATGIFGRFLFSFVPAQAGKLLQVSELREQVADMKAVLEPKLAESTNFAEVTRLFTIANTAPEGGTLVKAMLRDNSERRRLATGIDHARTMFRDEGAFNIFREGLLAIARARMQIAFYATLKRVFRAWLVIHIVVSIFMVALIAAHVAVTTYLGYTWIFAKGH